MPGASRDAVDRAALDGLDVIEVQGPHARPPLLVPGNEAALALRLHALSYEKHLAPWLASSGYTEAALEAVAAQVCRALDEGPLSSVVIRARVTHPDAGELMIGALVHLSLRGVIRRFPADGRIDSSKYLYELRHPDDRPAVDAQGDPAGVVRAGLRLFLQRHGPASVDEMADSVLLTKGAIRKALADLQAERIGVSGWTDDAWLLADDVRAWKRFNAQDDRVVLLPYRDPFVWRRRPPAVLAARPASSPVLNSEFRPTPIADITALHHHVIVVGGALAGVWEYDPKTRCVITRVWKADKALRARVAAAAAETETFVRQQVGDLPLSAVDPAPRRAKRIAFCRGRGEP